MEGHRENSRALRVDMPCPFDRRDEYRPVAGFPNGKAKAIDIVLVYENAVDSSLGGAFQATSPLEASATTCCGCYHHHHRCRSRRNVAALYCAFTLGVGPQALGTSALLITPVDNVNGASPLSLRLRALKQSLNAARALFRGITSSS